MNSGGPREVGARRAPRRRRDVGRAAAHQDGASRPAARAARPGRAGRRHQGRALVAVRSVRGVEREGGQVALGGGAERRLDVAIAGPVRVAVQQRGTGRG